MSNFTKKIYLKMFKVALTDNNEFGKNANNI